MEQVFVRYIVGDMKAAISVLGNGGKQVLLEDPPEIRRTA